MTLNGPEQVRKAFGCFATGVAIATTKSSSGEPIGITISSFNSVSLEPPLVLWSLGNDSVSYDAFANAEHFAVNVLARDQEELSARFAATGKDKWSGLAWTEGAHGSPILPEFSACFECSTEHRYPGGDHLILVGRVLRFEDRGLDPLIFYRSQFRGAR
jgi:3-hydroxy-9,10-secoandrosta-1,3,5(10)-triene-9,17-dione monooxygenase reductase component